MSFKAALAAILLLAAAPARGQGKAAAVLSSGGGAYLEAFSAFQAAFGSEVPHFDLSEGKPQLPPGTELVVAFGSKAAAQRYPDGVRLVYAMAPGFLAAPEARAARQVKISLRASPENTLAKLLRLQPRLRRLRIFYTSPAYGGLQEDFGPAARAAGVEVTAVKVPAHDKLPALLRGALGRADAVWLPPDPLLITQDTFMLFREFSWGNAIPLYAATKGLARDGACASVGVSFAEAGAAAAAAAKELLAGKDLPEVVYPEKAEVALNATAARKCGLDLPPDAAGEAAYYFP